MQVTVRTGNAADFVCNACAAATVSLCFFCQDHSSFASHNPCCWFWTGKDATVAPLWWIKPTRAKDSLQHLKQGLSSPLYSFLWKKKKKKKKPIYFHFQNPWKQCQLPAVARQRQPRCEHSRALRRPCVGTFWIPSRCHQQTPNAMKEAHMLKQTL